MRALIVGGSGAIGAAVARHACDAGLATHVAVRATSSPERLATHPGIARHVVALGDAASVAGLLGRVRPDWILMAAFPDAGHATGAVARRGMLLGMGRHLLAVMEALEQARYAGTLTWLGSAMAYGLDADIQQADAPLRPATFRGAVKAAESVLAARLAATIGVTLTELRVFTGYGPYEQRERLVPRLLRAALDGGRVPLAATPAHRDWVHYDDIATACLASAAPASAGQRVFNACSGVVHDTRDVARLLEEITGRPLVADETYAVPERYGDAVPGALPTAAAGLDWAPRVSLRDGLERSWRWARSEAGRAWLLRAATVAA